MIRLTRINRKPLVLNSDLIEYIEVTPDTVITMVTGQKFMVQETSDEIIGRIVDFRRELGTDLRLGLPAHLAVAATSPVRVPDDDGEDY